MGLESLEDGKSSFAGKVIPQLVAFVFFLALPAGLTATAPVSWIKFQRQEGRVTARADVCLLFFIPYSTLMVDPVTGLSDRTKSGSTTRYRRTGTDKYVQAETQGFLAIEGPDGTAEVPVTPHDLKTVTEKCEAFLNDPQATEFKLFVVANWKFSVIGGGPATLLSAVYVFGVVCAIGMFLLRSAGFVRKK